MLNSITTVTYGAVRRKPYRFFYLVYLVNSIEMCYTLIDTGLYYMRSRYYSPKVKRFLTLDSELGDISETADDTTTFSQRLEALF